MNELMQGLLVGYALMCAFGLFLVGFLMEEGGRLTWGRLLVFILFLPSTITLLLAVPVSQILDALWDWLDRPIRKGKR
jgi:hypothetical protein